MPLHPHTDKEWETLPYVIYTSDKDWYYTCLDCEVQLGNEYCFEAQSSFLDGPGLELFNDYGKHRNTSERYELHFFDSRIYQEEISDDVINSFVSCNNATTKEMSLSISCYI